MRKEKPLLNTCEHISQYSCSYYEINMEAPQKEKSRPIIRQSGCSLEFSPGLHILLETLAHPGCSTHNSQEKVLRQILLGIWGAGTVRNMGTPALLQPLFLLQRIRFSRIQIWKHWGTFDLKDTVKHKGHELTGSKSHGRAECMTSYRVRSWGSDENPAVHSFQARNLLFQIASPGYYAIIFPLPLNQTFPSPSVFHDKWYEFEFCQVFQQFSNLQ